MIGSPSASRRDCRVLRDALSAPDELSTATRCNVRSVGWGTELARGSQTHDRGRGGPLTPLRPAARMA